MAKKKVSLEEAKKILKSDKVFYNGDEKFDVLDINRGGDKYNSEITFEIPQEWIINKLREPQSPIEYFSAKELTDGMNIDFDGEMMVLLGKHYPRERGKAKFELTEPTEAKDVLIRFSWGGRYEPSRGISRNYANEEKETLFFNKRISNGGGIGKDYWIVPVGFVKGEKIRDVSEILANIEQRKKERISKIDDYIAQEDLEIEASRKNKDKILKQIEPMIQNIKATEPNFICEANDASFTYMSFTRRYTDELVREIEKIHDENKERKPYLQMYKEMESVLNSLKMSIDYFHRNVSVMSLDKNETSSYDYSQEDVNSFKDYLNEKLEENKIAQRKAEELLKKFGIEKKKFPETNKIEIPKSDDSVVKDAVDDKQLPKDVMHLAEKKVSLEEAKEILNSDKIFYNGDKKFNVLDVGKYNSGVTIVVPQKWNINEKRQPQNPINYVPAKELTDGMNIDFDGETEALFGKYRLSKNGKPVFELTEPTKAKDALIKVNWGGSLNSTAGAYEYYAKQETGATFFNKRNSVGGGLGNDYWVLPVGFVKDRKQRDVSEILSNIEQREKEKISEIAKNIAKEDLEIKNSIQNKDRILNKLEPMIQDIKAINPDFDYEANNDSFKYLMNEERYTDELVRKIEEHKTYMQMYNEMEIVAKSLELPIEYGQNYVELCGENYICSQYKYNEFINVLSNLYQEKAPNFAEKIVALAEEKKEAEDRNKQAKDLEKAYEEQLPTQKSLED